MNANNICKRAVKGTKRFLTNHGEDIFSVLAGIGVIATGISSYELGKTRAEILDDSERRSISKRSTIAAAKAIGFGAGTIGCIYGARHYGKLREKSLLAACSVLASYCVRQRGIREDDVASGQSDIGWDSSSIKMTSAIESTDTDDIIFIEDFTGRKFRTTWAAYEDAKRKLQEQFSISQCVVLNDFYELLGLEKTNAGEILGWTIDQMILGQLYDGETIPYEDALTQLCIEEDTDDDGNVVIYYCILPIGGLAGVGPCNY